jgi:diaminopimelate decarboxylase
MPMSQSFKEALSSSIEEIWLQSNGESCHVFHEAGLRQNLAYLNRLAKEYKINSFKEFFAVKATPIPYILRIIKEFGFGFDCSSRIELMLARQAGARPEDIMFTSNNTRYRDFELAMDQGGSIINLDDVSFLDSDYFKKHGLPKTLFFRINPGNMLENNDAQLSMSGKSAKYGIMVE